MDLARLFSYNTWANREVLAHRPAKGAAILAHIIGAEELWMGRIRGDARPAVVWPTLPFDETPAAIDRLDKQWKEIIRTEDLRREVPYTNSKGERFTSTVDDILMHVILHGSYHRGQIATLVRGGGETPAYTDYIHCVRQGFLSPED